MNEKTRTEKKWTKPELYILVRNRPEEAVLQTCKGAARSGPFDTYGQCVWDGSMYCSDCSGVAPS